MTRGEIIRIARGMDMIDFRDEDEDEHVAQFVDFLVALVGKAEAATREECAKVCDDYAVDQWNLYKGRHPYTGGEPGRADPETQGRCLGAEYLANALRARSEKGTT